MLRPQCFGIAGKKIRFYRPYGFLPQILIQKNQSPPLSDLERCAQSPSASVLKSASEAQKKIVAFSKLSFGGGWSPFLSPEHRACGHQEEQEHAHRATVAR